jgi:hypothetical protein
MRRFVKEYARYLCTIYLQHPPLAGKTRKVQRILYLYEKEYITTREAMQLLAKLDEEEKS